MAAAQLCVCIRKLIITVISHDFASLLYGVLITRGCFIPVFQECVLHPKVYPGDGYVTGEPPRDSGEDTS